MQIAIVGAGIAGLSLALNLQKRGIGCRIFEKVSEIREIGVGITLLPHAMRELANLGLAETVVQTGIEIYQSEFYNRFGQLIYEESRGLQSGYSQPEICIHRGRLHRILYDAALARLPADSISLGQSCIAAESDEKGVTLRFAADATGAAPEPARFDAVVACDGINSALRANVYPDEPLAFAGINTWRGVTRRRPVFEGHTYTRIGSIRTGKLIIYPIARENDEENTHLLNWMAEIEGDRTEMNDWNQPGRLEDFIDIYKSWQFDWLDVPQLLATAETVLEYPMVDRDPVDCWTFGRLTLAGDAAHPMYPRGSNGAAQAAIDARILADCLARLKDPAAAFKAYEAERRPATAAIVESNRRNPPDIINIRVEELVGDRPFDRLDRYISNDELKALSETYKRVAGFAVDQVGAASA